MPLFRQNEDKFEPLRKVPLFKDLSNQQLAIVAQNADEVQSQPGDVLTRQGHLGHEFILIVEGRVRVERDGEVVAHMGPGEFLGEIALIDGKPRTATATTEEPSVLLVVQARAFNLLLDTVPGLQRQILLTFCERLRACEGALDAAHRVA